MEDIYSYIKSQESAYKLPIPIVDGYEWSMYEHIRLTILYKNSQLSTGKGDDKPVKNIILPMLRLQYRTEGFDVKDIELYINDSKEYYKSFLVRKYHDKWARDNSIDTFIDALVESYVDFGGALIKKTDNAVPFVVPMQSIAFCDQTDILKGIIAIKHNYSPSELLDMEAFGWGNSKNGATMSLEDVIDIADDTKQSAMITGNKAKTPGKYIEVYELHGMMPERWLKDDSISKKYVNQMQIVCFYQTQDGNKKGITLFRGKEEDSIFKLLLRDEIFGRGLGLGGAEELFESQVWTTYDQIRIKGMLDAASKVILKTTDPTVSQKHPSGLKNLDNLEIIDIAPNTDLSQLNTTPINMTVFENNISRWNDHAQQLSGATDALLGVAPTSGTPFALQNLVTQEGIGIHDYRRGKISTFVDEIYRDWIIPDINNEISSGTTFLAELDLDELQSIADNIVVCTANDYIKEKILNGEIPDDAEIEQIKQQTRDEFMKGGNKKFIEIFKKEFNESPIDVVTNIKGKQKNQTQNVEKLTNIFRQIIASPQALDDPRMAKIFNEILENSGLSPVDFYQKPSQMAPPPIPGIPSSVQPLTPTNQ